MHGESIAPGVRFCTQNGLRLDVRDMLGEGGFGRVFEACTVGPINRRVVVKV